MIRMSVRDSSFDKPKHRHLILIQ